MGRWEFPRGTCLALVFRVLIDGIGGKSSVGIVS